MKKFETIVLLEYRNIKYHSIVKITVKYRINKQKKDNINKNVLKYLTKMLVDGEM